jgi:2-dehydropantoate 2-reductase
MKILMFGRGVISTQYAWAFEQAGHTVEFYVRPGRKAEFGDSISLNISDARKNIRGYIVNQNWKVKLMEALPTNHNYDLIFVSVQHYHIGAVADFLSDKTANATVFIFNNFWEEPLSVVEKLPFNQLVFGFPMAGGGFDEFGVLNGALMGSATIGSFGTAVSTRTNEVIALFQSANIKTKIKTDFRDYLLGHFVVDAAFALERIKYPTGEMFLKALKTNNYWRNVMANGKELLPILRARNVNVANSSDLILLRLPPWLISFVMKIVLRFLPPAKQMLAGHSNMTEMTSYCQDVLQTGKDLNISLPRFEANKKLFQKNEM